MFPEDEAIPDWSYDQLLRAAKNELMGLIISGDQKVKAMAIALVLSHRWVLSTDDILTPANSPAYKLWEDTQESDPNDPPA